MISCGLNKQTALQVPVVHVHFILTCFVLYAGTMNEDLENERPKRNRRLPARYASYGLRMLNAARDKSIIATQQ